MSRIPIVDILAGGSQRPPHMLPEFAGHNQAHCGIGDPVLRRQGFTLYSSMVLLAHLKHFLLIQLGESTSAADWRSPLRNREPCSLGTGRGEQMLWIDAIKHAAFMADHDPFWDWSVFNFPGDSMHPHRLPPMRGVAPPMGIMVAQPPPASIWLFLDSIVYVFCHTRMLTQRSI